MDFSWDISVCVDGLKVAEKKKKIELCGGGGFPVRGEMENESRKRGAAPKVVGVICCR